MSLVAATVLSGFLGAGKTTLLNGLLQAPLNLRIAVIVNEFGSIGIDGSLVAGGEQFVQLDNGCLCCALNEDLMTTLKALQARGGFDHLVVETTGMADPLPVAWAFTRPGLSQYYRVDAIVTVVDAAHIEQALGAATEACLQIERADIIVLNKLDLVNDDGAAARHLVQQHNTLAPILKAQTGVIPWDMLLDHKHDDAWFNTMESEALANHAHHHPTFETWAFELPYVVDDQALEDLVYQVATSVYRFKGLVRTNAEWEWTLINAVAGRIDIRPYDPPRPPKSGGLVFIGPALDRDLLQTLCGQLMPVV